MTKKWGKTIRQIYSSLERASMQLKFRNLALMRCRILCKHTHVDFNIPNNPHLLTCVAECGSMCGCSSLPLCVYDPEGPEHVFFFTDISSLPPLLIHNSKVIRSHKWGKSGFKRNSTDLPFTPSPEEACNCPLGRHSRQLSSCYAISCCDVLSSIYAVK